MITSFFYISIITFFLNGCNPISNKSSLIKNTSRNFKSIEADLPIIKKFQENDERYLLMFYADWCGYCLSTKPDYQSASNNSTVTFLLLNSNKTGAKEFMAQEKVGGYPTIKKYKGTEFLEDYRGDRSVESFIAFAESE